MSVVRLPVILTGSSLAEYVKQAQENMGTAWPVVQLDKRYHVEPKDMRERVLEAIEDLSRDHDTATVRSPTARRCRTTKNTSPRAAIGCVATSRRHSGRH